MNQYFSDCNQQIDSQKVQTNYQQLEVCIQKINTSTIENVYQDIQMSKIKIFENQAKFYNMSPQFEKQTWELQKSKQKLKENLQLKQELQAKLKYIETQLGDLHFKNSEIKNDGNESLIKKPKSHRIIDMKKLVEEHKQMEESRKNKLQNELEEQKKLQKTQKIRREQELQKIRQIHIEKLAEEKKKLQKQKESFQQFEKKCKQDLEKYKNQIPIHLKLAKEYKKLAEQQYMEAKEQVAKKNIDKKNPLNFKQLKEFQQQIYHLQNEQKDKRQQTSDLHHKKLNELSLQQKQKFMHNSKSYDEAEKEFQQTKQKLKNKHFDWDRNKKEKDKLFSKIKQECKPKIDEQKKKQLQLIIEKQNIDPKLTIQPLKKHEKTYDYKQTYLPQLAKFKKEHSQEHTENESIFQRSIDDKMQLKKRGNEYMQKYGKVPISQMKQQQQFLENKVNESEFIFESSIDPIHNKSLNQLSLVQNVNINNNTNFSIINEGSIANIATHKHKKNDITNQISVLINDNPERQKRILKENKILKQIQEQGNYNMMLSKLNKAFDVDSNLYVQITRDKNLSNEQKFEKLNQFVQQQQNKQKMQEQLIKASGKKIISAQQEQMDTVLFNTIKAKLTLIN